MFILIQQIIEFLSNLKWNPDFHVAILATYFYSR